jgi:hypothetical protein
MSKRLAPWLICSLACSIAALIAPALGAMHVQGLTIFNLSFVVSMGFSIAWLLIFVVALRLHGRRGLWLLSGLPPAVFWPAAFLFFIVEAASGAPVFDF